MVRTLQHRVPANIEFSTVHAAKGRESEHVIILDLSDNRYGFPCRAEDDPLMELVLPPAHGQEFPHAEERRLFYVAMTRTIRSAYLIADARNPSPFVRELLKSSPEVEDRGELAPPCPKCPRGVVDPVDERREPQVQQLPQMLSSDPQVPGLPPRVCHHRRGESGMLQPRMRTTPENMPRLPGRSAGPQNRTNRILGMQPVPVRALLPLHGTQEERREFEPAASTPATEPRYDETPQKSAVTGKPDSLLRAAAGADRNILHLTGLNAQEDGKAGDVQSWAIPTEHAGTLTSKVGIYLPC